MDAPASTSSEGTGAIGEELELTLDWSTLLIIPALCENNSLCCTRCSRHPSLPGHAFCHELISRTSMFLSCIARGAMNFMEQRVFYSVRGSVTGPSADLTILLAAICIAFEVMRLLCALSTPGKLDDPIYSISLASSFGAGGP